MDSRSIFALRVVRCPSCHARLPLKGSEPIVVCEYCDARVELSRRRRPEPPRPKPEPPRPRLTPTEPGPEPNLEPELPRHVARPRYSLLAGLLTLLPILVIVIVAMPYAMALWPEVEAILELPAPPPATGPTAANRSAPPLPATEDPSSARSAEPKERTRNETRKKSRARKPRPTPSGPVLSVADARAKLEPQVLACMRKAKTHSIRAYMGNEQVGAVSLLKDSRTRVDGLRATLIGTPLGACIDEAGASLRTRAFESNYVRLDLRNRDVPDPLAGLPAKADRSALVRAIEALDPEVRKCAARHGAEGLREVFYFTFDGPTGTVISVRGSYGSRRFRRCAEPIYRSITIDRVQQLQVKHTHHVQL